MDNQHKHIKGYRDLDEGDISVINAIKSLEAEVANFWNGQKLLGTRDPRWLSVAKTHFEEGFSAFVRSVAQPKSPFDR